MADDQETNTPSLQVMDGQSSFAKFLFLCSAAIALACLGIAIVYLLLALFG